MASLEHPALLVSSLLISLTLIVSPTSSLKRSEQDFVWVKKGDALLKQKGNLLMFKQTPFSGIVFQTTATADTITKELYLDGKEDGFSEVWDEKGNKIEERIFKNGKRVGIHQGWHPNGKLKFKYSYKDDYMDGVAEEWFVDGTKYKEMHYVKGHESGMQKMWAEDGSIRANYEARNGRNYGLTGIKSCKNIWQDVEETKL